MYTRELADSALEWITSGKSLRSWSAADPSRPKELTIIRWALRNHDGFGQLYREACRVRTELLAEDLVEISDAALGGDMAHVQAQKLRTDIRKWVVAPDSRYLWGQATSVECSGPNDSS
jgi:hypothetical protein